MRPPARQRGARDRLEHAWARRRGPSTGPRRPWRVFEQRAKAEDGQAKVQARTAQTAIETSRTDTGGSYAGADLELLEEIEPTLAGGELAAEEAGTSTYKLRATSGTGQWFEIRRLGSGVSTYPCGPEGEGGCPADGTWTD